MIVEGNPVAISDFYHSYSSGLMSDPWLFEKIENQADFFSSTGADIDQP